MTARVYVTRAQVAAARAMVARSLITGRHVSDSVRMIAGAKMWTPASSVRPVE